MKRVLLTGATGFIGRNSIPFLLQKNYEIHAISSKDQYSDGQLTWHKVDLLDPLQVAQVCSKIKPTHLLHFAWYAVHGKFWNAKENLDWVAASLSLLKQFSEQGRKRVVIAGTCAEYDWSHGNGMCHEDFTPRKPASLYGTCKAALHQIVESFSKEAGLSAAWGRIFHLYGPNEHPGRFVSAVIRKLLSKEEIPCSDGNQKRDFLHVEDVASAFVTLLDSDLQGAINIASGVPTALKDVSKMIADKIGDHHLVKLGALPCPANHPLLLIADASRLTKELGWKPRYDLESGLYSTIDWWKQAVDYKT
jgi:nucleoside-diphosphate-sugar epimerase